MRPISIPFISIWTRYCRAAPLRPRPTLCRCVVPARPSLKSASISRSKVVSYVIIGVDAPVYIAKSGVLREHIKPHTDESWSVASSPKRKPTLSERLRCRKFGACGVVHNVALHAISAISLYCRGRLASLTKYRSCSSRAAMPILSVVERQSAGRVAVYYNARPKRCYAVVAWPRGRVLRRTYRVGATCRCGRLRCPAVSFRRNWGRTAVMTPCLYRSNRPAGPRASAVREYLRRSESSV